MPVKKVSSLVAALRDYFDLSAGELIPEYKKFTEQDKTDFEKWLREEGYDW